MSLLVLWYMILHINPITAATTTKYNNLVLIENVSIIVEHCVKNT